MWLVASSIVTQTPPALVRELRRFNMPIQLAVAAARDLATHAVAPADAAILSLAPCQSGSPELHDWIRKCAAGTAPKVNPTWTLHAVDNLALSVLTMALRNHAWGMSLGGAAGMCWAALEMVLEREEREVIVLAGDQLSALEPSPAVGVALLFARERTRYRVTGRPTRLVEIARAGLAPTSESPAPHAAAGLHAMLAALREAPIGPFPHAVPPGDGRDDVVVRWELS